MILVLLLSAGVASAGRKRVVVLDFEGDKAEKYHADLIKLIKKSHTVVSTDKWNGAAEEMSASTASAKNIKKVAKKLRVDGIISGSVEKRRDEFILRLKIHAGTTGQTVGSQVNLKTEDAKLDAASVKDELIEVIAGLDSNRDGGGEEEGEEEKPSKKPKKVEEEEEEKPAKKPKKEEEEEEKPVKKGFSKKTDEEKGGDRANGKKTGKKVEEEEEVAPPKKPAKKVEEEEPVAKKEEPKKKKAEPPKEEEEVEAPKKKKVASKEDGEGEGESEGVEASADGVTMDEARMYSPGERAVDAIAGLSFTGRRMSFVYTGMKPPGYKQYLPLPGLLIDLTLYPLAIGHKGKGIAKGFGVTAMYDRVLYINSKSLMGTKLGSSEQRYAFGIAFRYPFNDTATAPVIGASLRYGKKSFSIDGDAGIPNVSYTVIDPQVFFHYPVNEQIIANVQVGFMAVTNTGAIQTMEQYGPATVTGFEGEVGLDYMLKSNLFIRGAFRFHTFGFKFKGTGAKSQMGMVTGARDTYFGPSVTGGYAF